MQVFKYHINSSDVERSIVQKVLLRDVIFERFYTFVTIFFTPSILVYLNAQL